MGISLGVHSSNIKSSDGIEKCVPVRPLKKFPRHRVAKPGDLIAEIKALPKKCYVVTEPENGYWWVDGQFRPNDDTTLFVTSGCYRMPRTQSSWVLAKRMPAGRIVKYELGGDTIKGEIFSRSFMSNYPKVHMHPSGEYIGYVGVGSVMVETVLHEQVFEKHKDLRNCTYKYIAFSPNGKYAAILLSASRRFEMIISRLDRGFANLDISVDFYHLYNGFKGSTAYNEHLECKWSPDSSNIAVCTSIGYLIVLDKSLKPVVNVFEDILTNRYPSCAGAFDYDPRSCREVLAFGTNDRHLCIVNTESKETVYDTEIDSPDPIDCLQYSPRGDLIAMSLRNWSVLIIETRSFETVYELDLYNNEAITATNFSGTYTPFPSIMRLSFSSTGQQITTSSCDGYVRVWQLPHVALSLKELCRLAILSCVPTSRVKGLALPQRIIEELVAMPTMA